LRASGEAREGEKKRIRRGCWEVVEVDILGCWWWLWWCCCSCCEVGRVGLLEDECVWWRDVVARVAFCGRMQSRRERNRRLGMAREDMDFSRVKEKCEFRIVDLSSATFTLTQ
jgi:hypothetical protein